LLSDTKEVVQVHTGLCNNHLTEMSASVPALCYYARWWGPTRLDQICPVGENLGQALHSSVFISL